MPRSNRQAALATNKQGRKQESIMGKSNKNAPSLGRAFAATWRAISHSLFDSYHPEQHYMRGPGPKWREKHGQTPAPQGCEMTAQAMTQAHA
jgi:hypothetical protein